MESKKLVRQDQAMLTEAKGMLVKTRQQMEEAMKTLGLTPETLPLITLFPLLYVAWADESIAAQELKVIYEVAEEHGMIEGKAREVLGEWLETRPNEAFWKAGLYLVGVFMQNETEATKGTLLEMAERVAHAAGGFLNVAFTVSSREREALEKLTAALGLHNEKARKQVIEAAHAQFSERELSWQTPLQWQWVQLGSILITILLVAVFFIQRNFLDSFLLTAAPPAPPHLPMGWAIFFFVVLPALPFVIGGALIGWRSEEDSQREAILAVVIPVLMYWGFSLVFWLLAKEQTWDGTRWIYQLTLTVAAAFLTAASARIVFWMTSHKQGR